MSQWLGIYLYIISWVVVLPQSLHYSKFINTMFSDLSSIVHLTATAMEGILNNYVLLYTLRYSLWSKLEIHTRVKRII